MSQVQNRADEIELADIHIESNPEETTSHTNTVLWSNIEYDFDNLLKQFRNIEEALEYLNSVKIRNDLVEKSYGIRIRLEIEENFSSFSANNLQKFMNMFSTKSIVILFMSKSRESFLLFWKSKDIDYFLTFKPPEKKTAFEIKELYGFIACCLVNSLLQGYLGVKSDHHHRKDLNEIDLTQLADRDGFNILKLCAEDGNVKCMEILLSLNIFQDDPSDLLNAQSRAQFFQQFNVLLLLLKNNYTYPQCITEDKFPDDLKQFVQICKDIHEAVWLKNIEKITTIVEEHDKIRHFFNIKNESVLKVALKLKYFNYYEQLLSRDLILGPHEHIPSILAGFDDNDLTILREIHFRCKKDLPESHMNVLMMNTSISHDDIENDGKEKLVLRAYSVLNKDPQINPILKAVAASKRFTIVFDFKRKSVEVVDPTATNSMRGVFYPDRKICIGAKQLLDPSTENETFGTLAHELCHYAMYLTFKNRAKPYKKSDHPTKEQYKKIRQYCMDNREKEEIISFAFHESKNMHSAELIVRVVHLLAMYHNQPAKLQELKEVYASLFNYHSDVVIPAIIKTLPGIKSKADKEFKEKDKKISNLSILLFISIGLGIIVACLASWYFYKPVYKFSELSDQEKETVRNGLVIYMNEKVKLRDLLPENPHTFDLLTSDHISQFLKNETLNFNESKLHYLEKEISFEWPFMSGLWNKLFRSNINFQGEIIKIRSFFGYQGPAFQSLTSQQVLKILSGSDFAVGKKFECENKFYVERKFIPEDADIIAYEYEHGHYYNANNNRSKLNKVIKEGKSFQEFADVLLKISFREASKLIIFTKADSNYKQTNYDLTQKKFQFMYKTSNQIIEQVDRDKILILSSEAGTGKTVTFEQLSMKIKEKFPSRWVLYIDLPKHIKYYNMNYNSTELLKKILDFDPQRNLFEANSFEQGFTRGNAILIWNAFDEISPTYDNLILNLFKITSQWNNIQLICTRPLYSVKLSNIFKIRPWKLVPFNEYNKKVFLKNFFIYENVPSEKIQKYIEKVDKIVQKLKYNNNFFYNFNTPLMLRLIAEIHENKNLFKSANIYGIFEAFVEKKIEIWLKKGEHSFIIAKKLLLSGSLKIILQKFALLHEFNLFSSTTLGLKMRKLQIMQKNFSKDFPIEEISKMGILFINGKNKFQFSHKTLSEFFVAQYFIENIFDIDGAVESDEAELRLELFYHLTQIYGYDQQIITDFMTSFLQMRPQVPKKFNPTISKLLRTKFKNFYIRMLDTNYPKVFEFLFEFFKPDHDLIVDLLHVHEPETFYTAIFNPNHFALFTNPEEIKSLAQYYLTDSELQKFLTGKNQKGKILFGNHFNGLVSVTLSTDANNKEIEVLNSTDYWDLFPKIKNNLTVEEQKKLFVTALSPKIYLYYDEIFSTVDFSEYENFWLNYENLLTQNEMQNALGDALVLYFEIDPDDKADHEKFLNLFLEKAEKFLSNSQIFEMFLTKNILHEAHWDEESFKMLWNFLSNHTNKEERRTILLQDDLDDKNFYFYTIKNDLKNSYSNFKYPYFYYDFTPFKIFHRSLAIDDPDTFNFTKEIYQNHFNKSEIQEIILSSNDFLYYAIEKADEESLIEFTLFLKDLFKGNKKLFAEFLTTKIQPTDLSAFELVDEFLGLPHSRPKWFKNLKTILNS